MLVAGVIIFALSSLAGGLASSQGVLVGARLVQGVGAALMSPAALSELTTTFSEGKDRNTALGVWGAVSGMAFAGAFAMFFYITLYMQEILHYSPIKAGAAYLPITAGFAVAGGVASQLVTRVGTRLVVVGGAVTGGAGIYYLSRVPVHGSYVADLLPGFIVMSLGMGSVFVAVTTAANAGVPGEAAGLAAGLLNASQQVGSALGLAILSAIAITRTNDLLAAHTARLDALDAGYHRGLLVGSIFLIGAAVIALRIGNTRAAAPLVLAPSAAAPEHADT